MDEHCAITFGSPSINAYLTHHKLIFTNSVPKKRVYPFERPETARSWECLPSGDEQAKGAGVQGVQKRVRRQVRKLLLQKEPESDTGMLSQITFPRASEGGNPFRISFRIGSVV